jgi:hypothetical protein
LINEGVYTPAPGEGKLLNSPWNIAANFKVDMSLDADDIATMLLEYKADFERERPSECKQGIVSEMDIAAVSNEIRYWTDGYPYLVSRICQTIAEDLENEWTVRGVRAAAMVVEKESSTLFDDIRKNLESNEELKELMYSLLIEGKSFTFSTSDSVIEWARMFGFVKNSNSKVAIANRIFEAYISEYFIARETRKAQTTRSPLVTVSDVVHGGRLNMELCLAKFAEHYHEIYSAKDIPYLERSGRLVLLTYLRPFLNGAGFYHIESQLTDLRCMDVVVDFGADQFILELKIWRGEASHEKAYEQLAGYLGAKSAKAGYLVTFDFRKKKAGKAPEPQWVEYQGLRIYDVIL